MWTEKCKSITIVYQISIKKYTCAKTDRLVVSSVKDRTYYIQLPLQLIQLILSQGLSWSCSDLQDRNN